MSREAFESAATSVFRAVAPLAPGSVELLETLQKSYRIILYTQGDSEIQEKRIVDSGLYNLFDFIMVVEHKTSDDLSRIIRKIRPSGIRFRICRK